MKKILVFFFLLLLASKATYADTFRESVAFTQLKQKILLEQSDSAWQQAKLLEAEYLGDEDFDFLYGLAALKVQESERALYAFERVVANRPSWLDAQYYLAHAYFAMKNYQAVIEVTESLNDNENVSLKLKGSTTELKALAVALLSKQSLNIMQSVDVSLGYDSNVNAGTSEDNIFLPLLNQDIILSDNSKENSDSYLSVGYQLIANKTLTQSSRLFFSTLGKLHYFNQDNDFNRFSIRSNLQYKKDFADLSASVGIRVVPLWLNDRYYRTKFGATAGLSKFIDKRWLLSSEVFLGQTKNDVNRQLNTDDASIQLSAQYVDKRWRHALSLVYSQEQSMYSESQHNNRKIRALNYTADFAFNQYWLANANISYQHQAYQFDHPFFFEKRNDDMWLLGTSIQYQDSKAWSYRLSASIQDKESNLALFSYQRADINLSARMSF